MKLLRSLSVFGLQMRPHLGKYVLPKQLRKLTLLDASSNCYQIQRTHQYLSNNSKLRMRTNVADQSLDSSETGKQNRPSVVDEWFTTFMEKLQGNPKYVEDWKSLEMFDNTRYRSVPPMSVLRKLSGTDVKIAGLYENAMSLIGFIEGQAEKTNALDVSLLTYKICLFVFQKDDHQTAIGYYRQLCQKSVIGDGRFFVPATICSFLVDALSRTSEWMECLKLMESMGETGNATTKMLSRVFAAAVREEDDVVARDALDRIIQLHSLPDAQAFGEVVARKSSAFLLDLLRENYWVVHDEIADVIENHYKKRAAVQRVKIHDRRCSCCNNKLLPPQEIPDIDMKHLVETFYSKVLLQRDGALNSTPEELERFRTHLSTNPKPDVVIDALNVVHHLRRQNPQIKDRMLSETIQHFTKDGKKVTVISKQHVRNIFRSPSTLARSGHPVSSFFTENRSHDDLFAVYAAFHGNKGCLLVTKDEFRDHRFLLGPALLKTFKRWQQKHQVKLLENKSKMPSFQWPNSLEVVAQRSADGTLHIPFKEEGGMSNTYLHSNSWLCIKE